MFFLLLLVFLLYQTVMLLKKNIYKHIIYKIILYKIKCVCLCIFIYIYMYFYIKNVLPGSDINGFNYTHLLRHSETIN